jgi:hypothetical protein
VKNLITLQAEYQDEYDALTEEEKAELIREFTAHKTEESKLQRPTACARIQDVANVMHNMQMLVSTPCASPVDPIDVINS